MIDIQDRLSEILPKLSEHRRFLHSQPELLYDVHQTAEFVATYLKTIGYEPMTIMMRL